MKKRPGLTMIELLVTIGVIGIVAATTVPAYASMRNSVGLSSAARQLVSTLREAQNKSITSQDNAQFGVKFDSGAKTYTLYRVNPALDLQKVSVGLPITATNATVFNRLTGQATPTTITLGTGNTKTITISATGLITIS